MESCIYVLTMVMEDKVLSELYGGLVIDVELNSAFLLALELRKVERQPYTLTSGSRFGDVLCFT